jgi:hypothetical protein
VTTPFTRILSYKKTLRSSREKTLKLNWLSSHPKLNPRKRVLPKKRRLRTLNRRQDKRRNSLARRSPECPTTGRDSVEMSNLTITRHLTQ